MPNMIQFKSWGRTAALGLLLGALSACEGLLTVDLPHILTDAALAGPETAETQVNSVIAQFECGSSAFAFVAMGHEDVIESVAGIGSANARYRGTPDTGGSCDSSSSNANWFDQMMGARAAISRLTGAPKADSVGVNAGVYDRIQTEWDLGVAGERLSAIAAIYMAATMSHFGEFYCEIAFDGSELLSPDAVLVMAEDWITNKALGHITGAGGDFAMPFGIATSAQTMAIALRARIRWARRDFAGAAADAATVPDGFTAWITRENGEQRRNKIFHYHTQISFGGMYGVVDFWDGANKRPNPATGQLWPTPIPFTGYIFLGIMPDGRTIDASGNAVRWAEELRDANEDPIPLAGMTSANADTRVTHIFKTIQGPDKREAPSRYSAEDDDIPLVNWTEMRLIEADNATAAGAIAIVNNLRTSAGVQTITSGGAFETALLGSPLQLRMMLLEERRRVLFSEGGRYWSTKIQNTDLLWFPRNQGFTPFQGYSLFGGVRLEFPGDEYINNPNWNAAGGTLLRGTGCTSLFGSQAPVRQ